MRKNDAGKKRYNMEIGNWNLLRADRIKDVGVYLTDGTQDVLLPKKQVPAELEAGDNIKVFLYKDSEDRLIATVHEPLITIGEMARLKVKSVADIGAFLDWGLEKDLFLPFHEQTVSVKQEKSYLVKLYLDKSERLAASMRITDDLIPVPEDLYRRGDHVKGTVVRVEAGFGVFVAIDNTYEGLIHQNEIFDNIYVGDEVECRIIKIREDGKTDLAMREEIPQQRLNDAEMVYGILKSYNGHLPFTDKSASSEMIHKEFGISKNAFKRALGHLLKENRIKITEEGIDIIQE